MRRPIARLAGACALAVATATFAGTALAGGGNGSSANAPGQQKQEQAAPQQAQSQQAGVKPSSTTQKNTTSKVGDSPDTSKRYGNGTTAAQVAKSRGAGSGVQLSGPGNSQPHKVCGRDVHAVKTYNADGSCGSTKAQVSHSKATGEVKAAHAKPEHAKAEVKTEQAHVHEKVTICHATGSVSNPYVAITIDKHGLNGHRHHADDIVPAPAGGCPSPTTVQITPAVAVPREHAHETITICHATGSETNLFATITIDKHGLNGHDGHDGDIVPAPATGCPASVIQILPSLAVTTANTQQAAVTGTATTTTQSNVVVTPQGTVTTQSNVVTPQSLPAVQAIGGVAGAQATLASPKKKARGGVLGTVSNVASGNLPFTGFPVWVAVLIALAVILTGLALRRRGAARL